MKSKRLSSIFVLVMSVIILMGTFCLPASAATAMKKTTITYESAYVYTGKAIKPTVTVKNGKTKLKSGTHYTVSYKNNKNVGKATITVKGKGSYTGTVNKYFYISPKAVTNLKATVYANKIKLTWDKVTGATGYQVYQKVSGSWKKIATPTSATYTVTGLSSATKYEFRVRAYAKAGDKTLYSPSYKNITKTTTIGKVSGIAVSDITDSTAKLTWNKVQGATSYRVVFTNTSTNYRRTQTAASNSIALTNLDALSAYSVKITAMDVEKNLTGAESAEFKFNTGAAAVRNLTATLASDTVVNLSWTASFGADGYQVYYSKVDYSGNPTKFEPSSFVTGTTCSLSNLTPCSTYIFKVVAATYTSSGTVYSKETLSGKVTMPVPKVTSFKSTTMSSDSVALSWTRPVNISGYTLYKDGKYLLTLEAKTTSYTLTGLSAGSSHKIEICAFVTDINDKKTEGEKTAVTITTSSDTVQSVSFNSRPSSLKVGATYQLTVKVTPESTANKSVTYSSSNTSVATVSSSGLITALKEGTTTIKAVSVANPSKEVSFTLTVTTAPAENVKVQSISIDPVITIYEGDIVPLAPEFTPANATNKGFTISGSDYSYQYKEYVLGGFLGTTTKTDICKFSDYIDVYSSTLLRGKKATIEPKNDAEFSFTVTVTTTDGSNKSATTKVKVLPKLIDVKYLGMEDLPWYYGNSAQLTATLHSTIQDKYKASDIRYKSSDTSIATVTNDGTVTCKGTGNVTITAYIPNTSYTGTFTFYSRGVVSIGKTYYDSCKTGKSYQLDARILPSAGNDEIVYYSNNEDIATVDGNGLVTFLKSGNVCISVFTDSDPFNYQQVWLTTGTFQTPSGTNAQLLSKMKTSANAVKSLSNLPSLTRYDKTEMSNFATTSKDLSASDLQEIFNSELTPRTTYLQSVSSSDSDFSVMKGKFIESVPVKNQSYIIASDLSADDVKSINVKDNGDYFYEMELVLKDEQISTLPSSNNTTRHGKVFDILTSDYINTFINKINSSGALEIKYSSFSQRYYNSKLTLKINKVTGNLESANFDMTLDASVKSLQFKSITTYTMDVSFTCNNVVNIVFSSYAN